MWYMYVLLALLTGSFVMPPSILGIKQPPRPYATQQKTCVQYGAWCIPANKQVRENKVRKLSECEYAQMNRAAGGKLDPAIFCQGGK